MNMPQHLLTLGVLLGAATALAETPLAVEGAEGFGAHAWNGQGGQEYVVTTLEDYLPGEEDVVEGSLRAAIEADGRRTVRVAAGGTIPLKAGLQVKNAYLFLDGKDAPAPGITLTNYGLSIRDTHDVVVRYLRIRPGDQMGREVDGIGIGAGAKNILIDHCSVSWAVDEVLSVSGAGSDNITVQWCIISEALHDSVHAKGPHGMGSLLRSDGRVSFHHNLFAHNNSRNPRPGTYGEEPGILLDFRNNVIYNWGSMPGYSAEDPVRMNYAGNYLRPGPSSRNRLIGFSVGGETTEVFADNNLLVDGETRVEGWDLFRNLPEAQRRDTPYETAPVKTYTPEEALERVLAGAGATLPVRDAVDTRVLNDVRNGTGRIPNTLAEVLDLE